MKPEPKPTTWFEFRDVARVPSPGLLVYRERVDSNLRLMLSIAREPGRLRPHIKTHKMREMVELQLALGITRFKCATLAEAEMAAGAGVKDLLLAYPPVGPAIGGLTELMDSFPETKFSVLADDAAAIKKLSRAVHRLHPTTRETNHSSATLDVLVDIDVGQHRTGLPVGPKSCELYALMASLPGLKPGGLHAYDGHISDTDVAARTTACEKCFAPVTALRRQLENQGLAVPRVVAGGTPTFRIHARRGDVECSPGTCVFWDAGYASKFPDLGFVPAALVLTRVISKPAPGRLCLDLGHKAIASEMPHPRVTFLNLADARAVMHNEEHLVVETSRSRDFNVGDCLYGVPSHICPTVALHSRATVVKGRKIVGEWKVAARARR
jgi:3-hydroxy-D-aspartate aldolase